MYAPFFTFREDPFGVSPDSQYFFPSKQYAEASATLYYAIAQRRGFAVLIAPPGLGKTSTLVHFAERIKQEARVAFFVHPHLVDGCVLDSVLLAMGLEPAADAVGRHRQLHAFLLDLERQGKTCVVIFDEAQNLTLESLETICMLSNFETPRHKLIQFVLAGQTELTNLLSAPQCEQVRQPINLVARLQPLSPAQVRVYVTHRLNAAGAPSNPFPSADTPRLSPATLVSPFSLRQVLLAAAAGTAFGLICAAGTFIVH
jgi:general secretion pathway protein A